MLWAVHDRRDVHIRQIIEQRRIDCRRDCLLHRKAKLHQPYRDHRPWNTQAHGLIAPRSAAAFTRSFHSVRATCSNSVSRTTRMIHPSHLACRWCTLLFALVVCTAGPAKAQDASHAGHDEHQHVVGKKSATPPAKAKAQPAKKKTGTHQHHAPNTGSGAAHGGHEGHGMADHAMKGFLGPYPMTREASGTSWRPEATPHEGVHANIGDWMVMWHALLNGVYDNQGGPRGDQKAFVSGMVMGMAQRQVGDSTFGLRAMVSPDPFMGPSGYPLLFAAGETANGQTLLVDRQHPHDLFMELAGTYSYSFSNT